MKIGLNRGVTPMILNQSVGHSQSTTMAKLVICFSALLLCVLNVSAANDGDSHPPVFSPRYYTKGILYIPSAEIAEPFEAWYDRASNRSRVDYYNGAVKTFQFANKGEYGVSFRLVPTLPSRVHNGDYCWRSNGTRQKRTKIQSLLPDLKDFEFQGAETLMNGVSADKWERTVVNDEDPLISKFIMWLNYKELPGKGREKIVVPVRYDIRGTNTLLNSHYDSYYFEYQQFSTDEFDEDIFDLPTDEKNCQNIDDDPDNQVRLNPMKEFMHGEDRHVRRAFKKFKREHNKNYTTPAEHTQRMGIFRANYRFIQSFNRANRRFRVAVNHFADRTLTELQAMHGLLPMNMSSAVPQFDSQETGPLNVSYDNLPKEFNWLIRGGVTPVKDQAMCGSCYAFATAGAVEGAYFVKCRRLLRLSEQALIDCTWDMGNRGCSGGKIPRDYEWIRGERTMPGRSYGIPLDVSYGPYLGQDGSCHQLIDQKDRVRISGFYEPWKTKEYRKNKVDSLKHYLIEFGPLTVNLGPTNVRSFIFYAEGVYDGCSCNLPDQVCAKDLDHSAVLVGYGEFDDSVPFWIVKNSWSEKWGLNGYFLVPQDTLEDCGISLYPTYVVVDNCLSDY